MSRYHRKDIIDEKVTPENAKYKKSLNTLKYIANRYDYNLKGG